MSSSSGNRKFGSLRRRFSSRRGSLPAESLSCLDLPAVVENNNTGSREDLLDGGLLAKSAPSSNMTTSNSSNRLSKMFCTYMMTVDLHAKCGVGVV